MDNLDILYRDSRLLFVDKPSGLVMHRGFAQDKLTVSDIVRDQIVKAPVYAIHRLDRGTSGVVGFALDSEMAKLMQEALKTPSTIKEYIALVRGPFDQAVDLSHPIYKDPKNRDGERVEARTMFYPLLRTGRWSLVLAYPRTGRLHQIRRHLKHLSLPVIGDTRYGKGEINRMFRSEYGFSRLALHARSLRFNHPVEGVRILVESAMDEALVKVLKELFGDDVLTLIETRVDDLTEGSVKN